MPSRRVKRRRAKRKIGQKMIGRVLATLATP